MRPRNVMLKRTLLLTDNGTKNLMTVSKCLHFPLDDPLRLTCERRLLKLCKAFIVAFQSPSKHFDIDWWLSRRTLNCSEASLHVWFSVNVIV